ncbi:MAG TPA: helix-turn-helix domain-containing protein [Variovorax sp.]|nr:helix-turn-helix domain-containing protein [Variovorax sp.]
MDFPIQLTGQLREHLRSLRKARGLTQAALGQLLGVGQARIAEIESNPGVVSVDQLMRVLSALHVSLVLRDDRPDLPANHAERVATTSSAPADPPRARVSRDADAGADAAPASGRDVVIRPKKGSW